MNPAARSPRTFVLLSLALALLFGCGESKKKSKHDDDDDDVRAKKEQPASASASAPKKDVDSSAITLAFVPDAVGAKYEYTSTSEFSGVVKVGDKSTPLNSNDKKRYTSEVLEVRDGAVVKERVRYDEYEAKDPGDKKEDEPVVGKVYIVEQSGSDFHVLDEKGKPISGSEAAYFHKKWKKFGTKRKFGPALDKKTVHVGDDVPDLAAAFAADQSGPGEEILSSKMTVKAREGDAVRFEYTIAVKSSELGDTTGHMTGSVLVDIATGLKLKDEGQIEFELENKAKNLTLKARGSGVDLAKKL